MSAASVGGLYKAYPALLFALGVSLFVIRHSKYPFELATESDPYYSLVIKDDYNGFYNSHGVADNHDHAIHLLIWRLLSH